MHIIQKVSIYFSQKVAGLIFSNRSVFKELEITETPRKLQGTPISLISAGLLALAFMGFSGLVK